jgi:erythritol transport system ATP-binding protein
MGAGRTELLETVAGKLSASSGEIVLEGKEISHLPIGERIARGLALVPEDRQRFGLVQTMSVGQNLSLASIMEFTRGIFTSVRLERALIQKSIRDVTVKTDGPDVPIGSLSGGNQQKVVIGKMLATDPKVILLDEPSRGIDIGAKAEVFRILAHHAAAGQAVVFTTSEVNECLSIAHRIIIMRRGRISAEFTSDITKEKIMAASGEAVAA